MAIQVRDVPENSRWEASEDGELAGAAVYRLRPGRIVFTHTVVDPAFEGRGVGSALVRTALDDARAQGLRVTPLCPFVRRWIDGHPDYADLVAPSG